ncbi:Alpha/Beta hydrolase protein [Dactylonectria macrodidyma]|uniref:Alpha/Beta hydrolase protein n=1 Tax=Dactylonectria macrodidyma TaxID=307937 RepID=A0A9P9FNZ8_9HYPO|nr:Alpha/Beta hydrolase protein [Dactylonectria macrodidyma]
MRCSTFVALILSGIAPVLACNDCGNPEHKSPRPNRGKPAFVDGKFAQYMNNTAACEKRKEVPNFTGFIKVGKKYENSKMWFWLFEQRDSLGYEPLVLHLGGGPGLPGSQSLLDGTGPCVVRPKTEWPIDNEDHYLHDAARVLYVDALFGTGYSTGPEVKTTEEAVKYLSQFLQRFYMKFWKFHKGPLMIWGADYNAHLAAAFAAEILRKNHVAAQKGYNGTWVPVPLRLLGFDSPRLDLTIQHKAAIDYSHENKWRKLISAQDRDILLKEFTTKYEDRFTECGLNRSMNCTKEIAEQKALWHTLTHGRAFGKGPELERHASLDNIRRIRQKDDPIELERLSEATSKTKWISSEKTQKIIGLTGGRINLGPLKYEPYNVGLEKKFWQSGDAIRSSLPDLDLVLSAGIPTMFVVGGTDFNTNSIGVLRVAEAIKHPGQEKFKKAETLQFGTEEREKIGSTNKEGWVWKDDAATVKTAGNITFITVKSAGHHVAKWTPNTLTKCFKWHIEGYSPGREHRSSSGRMRNYYGPQ